MFCLKTALLNIKRRKQKSALVVLISLIIAFFAFVYVSGIQTNERELSALPKAMPITARITNMNGSQIAGLEIGESLIEKITDSGYARDLYYTAQLEANFSDIPDEKNQAKEIFIRAVNDINAIPNYEDMAIELDGSTSLEFLRGNDDKCIADYVWLQYNDLSVGDSIEINLYGLKYDPSFYTYTIVPLGTSSLLIAGSMSPSGSDGGIYMDLLCPAGWAKEKYAAAGENFSLDSAMFTVADPLRLNEFKAAMKKIYLMPVDPRADAKIYGSALTVHDETFIKTATRLKSHLATLYGFAAAVFAVIVLVGYALSYLFMQSRRVEVVIMRSLGVNRRECVLVMLFEYAALGLLGSLLGMLVSMILLGFSGAGALLAFLLFYVSFAGGIAGSAYQLSKWTAMSGLVKVEA
jgi:hypothetical protein